MAIGLTAQAGKTEGGGQPRLQILVAPAEQHVGAVRCVAVHRDYGGAAGDQLEAARFVEAAAGQVQVVKVVAGGAQALEKVEVVLVPGEQPGDFGRATFNTPAVRSDHGGPRGAARLDEDAEVLAFPDGPEQVLIALIVVGRYDGAHAPNYSVPAPGP